MDTRTLLLTVAAAFVFCLSLNNQAAAQETGEEADQTHDDETNGEFRGDVDHNVDDKDAVITITTITGEPYVMLKDGADPESGNEAFEGVIPDILKAVCDKQGGDLCNYHLVLVLDNKYGAMDMEGQWNGMIGELLTQGSDIAAAPLTITDERSSVVDFSVPFEKVSYSIVVNVEDDIATLEDLLTNDKVTMGVLDGGSTMQLLRSQTEEPYSLIWPKIESEEGSMSHTSGEGITRVREGGYAFIVESSTAEYYTNRHCSLMTIDAASLPHPGYGFAFAKGSEFLGAFNTTLVEIMNDGQVAEIHEKWFDAKCGAKAIVASWVVLLFALVLSLFP